MNNTPLERDNMESSRPEDNSTDERGEGSIRTDFDWEPAVTVWGPDSLRSEPTGTLAPKAHKPWGIRHIFLGLGIAIGLNVVVSVGALALLTYRANEVGLSAADLNEQIASLTSNPIFLVINLLTLWTGLIAAPVIASYRNGARSLATDFWLRFNWKRDLLIGTGLAIALRVMDLILGALVQMAGLNPEDITNANFLEGQGVAALIVLGLAAAIGAPIAEELFFRGLTLQAVMKRWGPVAGVVISSVLFGLLHATPGSDGTIGLGSLYIIFVTGTLGAVLAITTLRTKRLGTAIIAHVVFNASGVLLTVAM